MRSKEHRHGLSQEPSAEKLGEFRGKWIAVLRGSVIASGDRALDVLRRMEKEHPSEKPVVYRVPAGEVMLL